MIDEKKKMTAQGSSVGADDGQSISQNSKFTIPDPDEKSNSPERDLEELYRKMRRMSDPAYLHTVTLDELMDNVFEGKSAVIENLLYTGAYILAGAPKIGKSFLVAQIAHHVSTGQDLWGYKVHQGTVLYLALEDDESRLQRRMFRMFGVEGTNSLHFATNAKMIGSGLDEQLEKFIREHSDTKLIIVDKQMFRLKGWQYKGKAKTPYAGKLTNEYIYSYLPDGVLDELKKTTPKSESGNRKNRFHQHLTEETGLPNLDKQLQQTIALMKASDTWEEFDMLFKKAMGEPVQMSLEDKSSEVVNNSL